MRIALVSVVSLLLGGCVSAGPPVKIAAPLDLKALELIHKKGTGRVEGQAFMRQRGGGVVTAAGEKVGLFVSTPYTEEALALFKSGKKVDPSTDLPNFKDFIRFTSADATGNFSFDNVAPGTYVVGTQVRWTVPVGRYIDSQEGGDLQERVTVIAGQTAKVIMSR